MASQQRQDNAMDLLMQRLKKQIDRFNRPLTTDQGRVLIDIANLLERETKLNLTETGMVDSGNLRKSITAIVKRLGPGKYYAGAVSKGIPYAAIHEYGGDFTLKMHRAMMWTLSKTGKLGDRESKGVITGTQWPRHFKARPYMRPALVENKNEILKMLASVVWGR